MRTGLPQQGGIHWLHRTTQTDGTGQLPEPQAAAEPAAIAPAAEPTAAVPVGEQPGNQGPADPPRNADEEIVENAAQDAPAAPETQDPPEAPEEQDPPVGDGAVDRNAPYWIVTRIVSKLVWRSGPVANIMAGGQ